MEVHGGVLHSLLGIGGTVLVNIVLLERILQLGPLVLNTIVKPAVADRLPIIHQHVPFHLPDDRLGTGGAVRGRGRCCRGGGGDQLTVAVCVTGVLGQKSKCSILFTLVPPVVSWYGVMRILGTSGHQKLSLDIEIHHIIRVTVASEYCW